MGKRDIQEIKNLLIAINTALVVRDPGNARAAEAYEGLRKQLNAGVKSHRSHIGHLVTLSESLNRNADIELIRDRVNDFLQELGVRTIHNYIPQLFEVVETVEGNEDDVEIVEPALAEEFEGSLSELRKGKVRIIRGPVPNPIPDRISPEIVTASDEIATPSVTPSPAIRQILLVIGSVIIGLLFGFLLFSRNSDTKDMPTKNTVKVIPEGETIPRYDSVPTTKPTTQPTGK